MPPAVPIAEIVRNGMVEGHHYGSAVAVNADGTVAWQCGDIATAMFPRSCSKPLQALAMVEHGLHLPPDLLALACASHSGEEIHLAGVRAILATAGLDESALQTPPAYPLMDEEMERVIRAGGGRTALAMNCSGKHAAMLLTCVLNGWPTETYREPDHPLQLAIAATLTEATGAPIDVVAIDGCGAPLFSTTLTGLARAFGALSQGRVGARPSASAEAVRDAIVAHPAMVSGTTRDELALLRALPGAIGKAGAESVYAVALPDGRALAIKCDDGAPRVRPVLMAAALEAWGVLEESWVDAAAVTATGFVPVLGHGEVVGEIRATLPPVTR